jgi:3-hydroxyacyl-CoA dehydrogenase
MAMGRQWAELTALAVLAVVLQQTSNAQEAEREAEKSETLEEMIVTAPQSMSSMRVAIVEAENEELLGQINDRIK